ncbi:hypothetical protein S83_064134 [Arachis hypogaea]
MRHTVSVLDLFFLHWNRRDRIGGDVKEAGSTATAVEIAPAEEVLLSMAGDLRGRPSLDVVPRDPSPITFPYLLQSHQEQLVLFLRPLNTSLALALAVLAEVVRSVFVVVGVILRMHVLRQIVHTEAFPHGVHHHPNAE